MAPSTALVLARPRDEDDVLVDAATWRAAAAHITRHGWVQHTMRAHDDPRRVCLLGGLQAALAPTGGLRRPVTARYGGRDYQLTAHRHADLLWGLAAFISNVSGRGARWNDSAGRTAAQVVRELDGRPTFRQGQLAAYLGRAWRPALRTIAAFYQLSDAQLADLDHAAAGFAPELGASPATAAVYGPPPGPEHATWHELRVLLHPFTSPEWDNARAWAFTALTVAGWQPWAEDLPVVAEAAEPVLQLWWKVADVEPWA